MTLHSPQTARTAAFRQVPSSAYPQDSQCASERPWSFGTPKIKCALCQQNNSSPRARPQPSPARGGRGYRGIFAHLLRNFAQRFAHAANPLIHLHFLPKNNSQTNYWKMVCAFLRNLCAPLANPLILFVFQPIRVKVCAAFASYCQLYFPHDRPARFRMRWRASWAFPSICCNASSTPFKATPLASS